MIRWKIVTGNRVGMVHDVLRVFFENAIDIIAMEVIPKQIHLKFDGLNPAIEDKIMQKLSVINGVKEISKVDVLPSEEREEQLRAVLNSISEGIIAINNEGKIITINPASEKIFHRSRQELLGMQLKQLLGEDAPMICCIQEGKNYDNQEMLIDTPKGKSHYLTSGRPIRDEQGTIIGAVAVMKDIAQVRQLIYKMTQPSMITFDDLIFHSKGMEQVVSLAKRTALSNSTILIRGESGTGKELFARAIHMASMRHDKPFVPINCGALPDSLLESELFGYEEGTFTGGRKGGKQGLFEMAHGGTLFLDEIGELPPHLQVKLLRVLQESKVRRVGGSKEISVNVRIITATNKNLEKMIEQREFREDLYYRLNVIPIHLPPLRQRKDDIPPLVKFYLQRLLSDAGKTGLEVEEKAMQGLIEYDWPGNVRELRNAIERAVHLAHQNLITWSDLFPEQPGNEKSYLPVEIKIHQITSLEQVVQLAERALLEKVLETCNSSRQIGEVLGVSHTTALNKLKKHNFPVV